MSNATFWTIYIGISFLLLIFFHDPLSKNTWVFPLYFFITLVIMILQMIFDEEPEN